MLIRVQAFERLTDRHPLLSPVYVSTKTQFFTQNCRLLGLNEFVWQIMLIFTFGLEKWIDFKPQPLDAIIQDITRLAVENILLFVVHPVMCNIVTLFLDWYCDVNFLFRNAQRLWRHEYTKLTAVHESAIRINVRRYSNFVNTIYFCLQKQQDLQHGNYRRYYEKYNYDNFEHYLTKNPWLP